MPAAKNEATDSKSSKRVLFKSEGRFRLGVSTIVECRLWVNLDGLAMSALRLFYPGGLNGSMQHFILEGKDGVRNGPKIS